jgi:prolyl 4-hydroxylase
VCVCVYVVDTPGQLYTTHHDHAAVDSTRPAGARALTFFLYLSDVEEGGETDFPSLNIRVTPSKGKALLWPNTLDHDTQEMDPRTFHQALPVKKGVKYAANAWIHLYDYQKADLWGCTGTMPAQ